MDLVLVQRAQTVVDRLGDVSNAARLLIAIAGVPGSGKSSFAARLVHKVNELLAQSDPESRAILIGLDGWHLTRAQLDAMDDPKLAHDRRGIHWTFDASAYVDFVTRLRLTDPVCERHSPPDAVIRAPSFDHALKDPTPDAIVIQPSHRIVVIEGLYTMLDVDPWRRAAVLMDERWWIQIDPARAKSRLIKRHVQTGVAKDVDEALWRAENNDEDNGKYISRHIFHATHTIHCIEDPSYSA